ncbi:MAG: hypothetical protein RIR16_398 [Actinomycetota bacterium]|jgi:uncharacterized protein YdhG (YjbR/CyaY superfamily)
MKPEVLEYLASQPDLQRSILESMLQVCLREIPDTEAVISYGIIGFRYQNKVPFFISGWKNHVSIHGGRDLGTNALKVFPELKVVGTTIQIALQAPLTEATLVELIRLRLEIFDESGGKR